MKISHLIGSFLFLTCVFAFVPVGHHTKIKVWMIGDSTMANKQNPEKNKEWGWGMAFQQFFDTARVQVMNHALNGRSTKSFIDQKRWQAIYEQLQPGDYVFIQFGHNDEKVDKPEVYADPDSAYKENLTRFVRETREKGAYPVLLTSVVRRKFDENGLLVDTHGRYPHVVRALARSLEVPLIDMQQKTHALVLKMGVEASKNLFMISTGKDDNTHFVKMGAEKVARLAFEGVRENQLAISKMH